MVTPKGKIKLKRLSNKASQFIAPARRKQPASYAYFLEHGHKGVKPTKKRRCLIAARLCRLASQDEDAAPHDFMESARSEPTRRPARSPRESTSDSKPNSQTNPERTHS